MKAFLRKMLEIANDGILTQEILKGETTPRKRRRRRDIIFKSKSSNTFYL
jgi:hypothetical protein